MDRYKQAQLQAHVHVDAGGRAFYKGEPVEVQVIGGVKKVLIPGFQYLLTFDELKRLGAKVDVVTLFSLAKAGAEGRWREEIQERMDRGMPSNVYVANARTIQRAIARGEHPPDATFLGRKGRDCTEVFATVDEVVNAMKNDEWRKTFSRGSRKTKK